MICRNCGKEIPDDVLYCGYCGAAQKIEEKEVDIKEPEKQEPVTVEEEKVTEPRKEAPVENEKPEVKEDTSAADQKKEEEKAAEETVESEDKTQTEEKETVSENKKETKEKLKDAGTKIVENTKPVLAKSKEAAHKVNWKDFLVYGEIIKKPFEPHQVKPLALWTGIVLMVLGNSFIFGSFTCGLFVLIFVFAGSFLMQYIAAKDGPSFHAGTAFENAFSAVLIPFIAMVIAGILMRTSANEVVLGRRLGLMIVLVVFAAVMLGTEIGMYDNKKRPLITVLVLGAMYAAIIYYLFVQYAGSIAGLAGF